MQEKAADHDPRPTLARLAVDGGHVAGVFGQPGLDISAKGLDGGKEGRVVVVKGVGGHAAIKLLGVVEPLRAQVVDEVVVLMFHLQEAFDVVQRVAVDGLDLFGWEAHGDDAIADVGQVQVEPILHMPSLVLANYGFEGGGHGCGRSGQRVARFWRQPWSVVPHGRHRSRLAGHSDAQIQPERQARCF